MTPVQPSPNRAINVTTTMNLDLLDRLDAKVREMGVSRSSFVVEAVERHLETMDPEPEVSES